MVQRVMPGRSLPWKPIVYSCVGRQVDALMTVFLGLIRIREGRTHVCARCITSLHLQRRPQPGLRVDPDMLTSVRTEGQTAWRRPEYVLGHICCCVFDLSAEALFVFLWQSRTLIKHFWKRAVALSAHTMDVFSGNSRGRAENESWHVSALTCVPKYKHKRHL